jgi:DNA-binding transcriptional LysR family regulator
MFARSQAPKCANAQRAAMNGAVGRPYASVYMEQGWRRAALDWEDLKFIHAIARHGSLSAAARALGTAQPTVSRRLSGVERRTGIRLFEREASGLSPTALCTVLLESLDQMETHAQAIERRIAARETGLQGHITLTSLGWFGDDVLAPLLARFGARHKLITIDLIN